MIRILRERGPFFRQQAVTSGPRFFASTALLLALSGVALTRGQDLAPRSYVITPVSSNAVIFFYSYNSGSALLDPTIPIKNIKGNFEANILSYYHSFSFFGRFANLTGYIPYVIGSFDGVVNGVPGHLRRSGMADARVRFAVNLKGARAMDTREFAAWHEKTTIAASVMLEAPSGQYDPARLVNPSNHRWALKPEVGFTRRWGKWALDAYAGVWLFTEDNAYFPGDRVRKQDPIPDSELHLEYFFKPRFWVSLDGNFWSGGDSSINGISQHDTQRNSRVGGTLSVPLGKHQSVKFSYSSGAYVTIGGDYRTVSAGWQYSWIGKE